MDFEHLLAELSRMSDDHLDLPPHDGRGMRTRRRALHEVLESEQAAVISVLPALAHREAPAILAFANQAWGDLKGLLLGVPGSALDQPPSTGAWSIRQTIAHLGRTERTYLAAVRYAVGRMADEPVLMPDSLRAAAAPDDAAGDERTMAAWFERLREESNVVCRRLGPEDLARPSVWSYHQVDVRFRLHRFSSHIVEHGIQCETILEALGIQLSDAARLARRISALRSLHRDFSGSKACELLDRRHATGLEGFRPTADTHD